MPASRKSNVNNITASIDATNNLLNDVQSKKKMFEETISKLINFNPTMTSPTTTNRQSPRLHVPSQATNTPNRLETDNTLVFNEISKLYDYNSQLISVINQLTSRCDELEKKADNLAMENESLKLSLGKVETDVKTVLRNEENKGNMGEDSVAQSDQIKQKLDVKEIENKIARLEQHEANKYVVFQGGKVDELIENSNINRKNICETIKEHLLSIVDRDDSNIIDEILTVKVLGKNTKILKVEISNKMRKSLFISTLKRRRPSGIYISEFLIPLRLKMFHDLRIFAKNIQKIDRVFTRDGLVYFKDNERDKIFHVENEDSLVRIKQEYSG